MYSILNAIISTDSLVNETKKEKEKKFFNLFSVVYLFYNFN